MSEIALMANIEVGALDCAGDPLCFVGAGSI